MRACLDCGAPLTVLGMASNREDYCDSCGVGHVGGRIGPPIDHLLSDHDYTTDDEYRRSKMRRAR
jgi:hypothetical protein